MYNYNNKLRFFGTILNVPPDVDSVYMKCRRMIHSCRTMEQLRSTRRYIDLWEKQLSEKYQYLYKKVIILFLHREQHLLTLRKIYVKRPR